MASALIDRLKKNKKLSNDLIFDPNRKIERFPTGCLEADFVCGGGFPRRRIIEIFGQEHSGKTALMCATAGLAQKRGERILFIDHEHTFDPVHALKTHKFNVEDENTLLIQPNTWEETMTWMNEIAADKQEKFDLIFLDSITACKPEALIKMSADDAARPGMHARSIGQLITKIDAYLAERNASFICTNQMRSLISIAKGEQNTGTGAGYNAMETQTTTGGNTLRFYAAIRLRLEYGGQIGDENALNVASGKMEKVRVANEVKVINVKNKTFRPFLRTKAQFNFPNDRTHGGWDNLQGAIDYLVARGRMQWRGPKLVGQLKDNDKFEFYQAGFSRDKVLDAIRDTDIEPQIIATAYDVYFTLIQETSGETKNIGLTQMTPEEAAKEDYDVEELVDESVTRVSAGQEDIGAAVEVTTL